MKIRKIVFVLIFVLTCLVFIGCCSSYSPDVVAKSEAKDNASRAKALAELEERVLKLKVGATIRDVRKAFSAKGIYLFTIQKNGHNYLCMIFPAGKGYGETGFGFPYYGVFEDEKLYLIMEDLPYRWEARRNKRSTYAIPTDPNIIFSTKGLFGQDLVDSLRKNFPKKKYESNIPLPIPVLIIWYPLQSIISEVLPNDCNCN